jgi:nitroreductase
VPVSEEDLMTVLEAGRLAPSAKNWQPWNFVLVSDRDQLRELTGVWQGAWHVGGAAAAIAIVAPEPPDDRWAGLLQYDLGHATMLMMLAAADLGIGTCHSSVQDQELARKILGFPEDHFLAYLLSLGYPADGPLQPLKRLNRRPFDEVVHRGRWERSRVRRRSPTRPRERGCEPTSGSLARMPPRFDSGGRGGDSRCPSFAHGGPAAALDQDADELLLVLDRAVRILDCS